MGENKKKKKRSSHQAPVYLHVSSACVPACVREDEAQILFNWGEKLSIIGY